MRETWGMGFCVSQDSIFDSEPKSKSGYIRNDGILFGTHLTLAVDVFTCDTAEVRSRCCWKLASSEAP